MFAAEEEMIQCSDVTGEGTFTPLPPGFLGDTGFAWRNKIKRTARSVEGQEGSRPPTTLLKTVQSN